MSANSIPQIYIPRVHNSYTWQDMKAVFDELLGEGCVRRVDIVKIKPRREGDKPPSFNRAYVHIKKWPEQLNDARNALKAGETINLYPDDNQNHYWMCVLNTKTEQDKPKGKPVFDRPAVRSEKTTVTIGDVLTNKLEHLTMEDVRPWSPGTGPELFHTTGDEASPRGGWDHFTASDA